MTENSSITATLRLNVERWTLNVSPCSRRAFSLIEVMIATALMSVIVLGLIIMFGQTQRAFRTGMAQVDVLESGRAALDMIARDVEQATATGMPESMNLWVQPSGFPPLEQSLVGGGFRTNVLQNLLFSAREGQEWRGVFFALRGSNYIGTLYRHENYASAVNPEEVRRLTYFTYTNRPNRIIDGVTHLRYLAYDHQGRLLNPDTPYLLPNGSNDVIQVFNEVADISYEYRFTSNALPAHLEIELGILEPKYADRVRNLPVLGVAPDQEPQVKYLRNHVGHVHIFRQRVVLRNADATAFQ
jgi:prepilin-type N-terminal cleavage/methylation domain-containing protein